jgi:hypothetical protein
VENGVAKTTKVIAIGTIIVGVILGIVFGNVMGEDGYFGEKEWSWSWSLATWLSCGFTSLVLFILSEVIVLLNDIRNYAYTIVYNTQKKDN